MAKRPTVTKGNPKTHFKVSLVQQPDFNGPLSGYVFDTAGNLLAQADIANGRLVLPLSEKVLSRTRLFIAPKEAGADNSKLMLSTMDRLGAYEPVLRDGDAMIDEIMVPGPLIEDWVLCRCWVRGRVLKADSGGPVCRARVHICEVEKLWRWILRLPELDLLRLRDDFLRVVEIPPLRRPPRPEPDPAPWDQKAPWSEILDPDALGPQPEPPDLPAIAGLGPRREFLDVAAMTRLSPQPEPPGMATISATPIPLPMPPHTMARLASASVQLVREALIEHAALILPYLCIWPYWWTFRCNEIAVVNTDALGRFEETIYYRCDSDKPDLYFWVEYEIAGSLETVYHPPIPCNTWWDYPCGTEVTVRIDDDRVPACDDEPDLPGCVVQVLSIGRTVSMSELQGDGTPVAQQGLTTGGRPFGGKIEPRVWFSRTTLRDGKSIHYYRWSYRRLTEGDGTPLAVPGSWTPLTRTVVRHFAQLTAGGVSHPPYTLGPKPVGAETNLFEIKPADVPPGAIEWTVLDEREDLASGHFETHKLGTGTSACAKALDAAGKYQLKLELFKSTGALVDWTAEGVDLQMTNIAAPFGTATVTTTSAPAYNRVTNAAGHTEAFSMVIRVDNNCCRARVHPVGGAGLVSTACGFLEFVPGASAALSFDAHHPNGFATFRFSVRRGVSAQVHRATASGRVGTPSIPTNDVTPPVRAYTLTPPSHYQESFPVGELLGPCARAAYSEALHVWTLTTDGYHRLSGLDSFDHDGFALTPP